MLEVLADRPDLLAIYLRMREYTKVGCPKMKCTGRVDIVPGFISYDENDPVQYAERSICDTCEWTDTRLRPPPENPQPSPSA